MKTYDIEFEFKMVCRTRCYSIKAESLEDALKRAESCIDKHGQLDLAKYKEVGGGDSIMSWHVENGTDHDYEIDASDITLSDNQDEDDEDGEEESDEDEAIGC